MIPPISVFRGNPDRSSAGGWAATPRRLISVAAAASVLSELGNVFQWRRRMEAGHGGLLLMEDVSVCLTRLQYQFKSLTGWSLPFMKVLLFSKQSLPAASNKATEDLIGRTQDACVTLYWLVCLVWDIIRPMELWMFKCSFFWPICLKVEIVC